MSTLQSLGILVLRLAAGGMMAYGHGYGKLQTLLNEGTNASFATIKYMESIPPYVNLGLAVFGELVCGVLIVVGLFTRLACVPAIATMAVAAFLYHGLTSEHPLFSQGGPSMEMAVLYLVMYVTLLFTGPGKLSLDGMVLRKE